MIIYTLVNNAINLRVFALCTYEWMSTNVDFCIEYREPISH